MMKYTVKLLRYLKGYVHIRAEGGFPERFLNLCYSRRINLWDICLRDNVLSFCISRSHFLKLRSPARKSGVSLTIVKKTGLVYRYRKYNKRIGLATGVLLFLTVHLILSMFVWCVDVQGNNTLSKSSIIQQAEKYGLHPGTFKKSFDEIKAARNIATDYAGKISWLSVNIKGSMAVLELREDNRIIGETENRPPCNIVADFDGVIISAQTFYGDCMIQKGNGVKKGDLLINGAKINEDMSTTFYAAKGKITALHNKEIELSESSIKETDGLKIIDEKYKISIFGLNIPLKINKGNDGVLLFSERKTLNINGYNLPFYIEKTVMCTKEKLQTESNAMNALEKFQHGIYTLNSNSTVAEKDEHISRIKDSLIFTGNYNLIDFIGEEKPILSEK